MQLNKNTSLDVSAAVELYHGKKRYYAEHRPLKTQLHEHFTLHSFYKHLRDFLGLREPKSDLGSDDLSYHC